MARHAACVRFRASFCFWIAVIFLFSLTVDARIGFAATELTTSDFDDFVKKNDKVLVDFYNTSDPQWAELSQELQTAIREVRSVGSIIPIAKVNVNVETALARKFVPNGPYPQLMWFQNGEATQYHRHLRKAKNVVDFVLALDRDPIQAVQSEQEIRESVNRAVWARLSKASPTYKVLETVASKHMDTVEFAFTEGTGVDIRWLEQGNTEDNTVFDGEATVENLERWVRMHLLRSEPLPDPQEGDSVPVVGHTFEQVVLQPDKDVFLLIYASWCGYSRKFMPTWDGLARRVRTTTSLVLAKMDGDRNSSPFPEEFSWHAYPTVFFVKAGSRKPVVFHGNRTEARLIDFIKEHGSRGTVRQLDEVLSRMPAGQSEVLDSDWEL